MALASWTATLQSYSALITTLAHLTLAWRSFLEWTILALSLKAAASASHWCSNASKSQIAHCLLSSKDLFIESIWLIARWASAWSSSRPIVGLSLQLLLATAVGESWMGLLSMEASVSGTLAWEDVYNGRAGTSIFSGGDMSALVVSSFSIVGWSGSWSFQGIPTSIP